MSTDMDLDEVGQGVDEGTSQGEATTTQAKPQRTTTNWQDDPKYREQQSKRDRELAQAQRAAFEAQQYAAQVEAQFHQTRMAGLEGEDRLVYQNQLLQKQLADQQRQRDLDAYALQRENDLREVARRTGVPMDELTDVRDVHEAWSKGWDYYETKSKSGGRNQEQEADDSVDLGSQGRPPNSTKAAKIQAKYDEARKQYDVKGQLEAMAQADGEGVTLKEW